MLDDIESPRGHIEYLPPFRHARFVQRQQVVTMIALRWQRVAHGLARLRDLLERRPFVTNLRAGLLARRLAQGARLLGKAIGRWRLAGVVRIFAHHRFERFQTRQQRQDDDVLLSVRESGKIGRWRFLYHDQHDELVWHCSQLFYCNYSR